MNFPRSLVAATGGLFIARKGEKQSSCRGGGSREVAKELARKFVLADTMAAPIINLTEYICTSSCEETPLPASLSESQYSPTTGKIEWPGDIKSRLSLGYDHENGDCPIEGGRHYTQLTEGTDWQICGGPGHPVNTSNNVGRFGENGLAEMNDIGIMVDIFHNSPPMRSTQTVFLKMEYYRNNFTMPIITMESAKMKRSRGLAR